MSKIIHLHRESFRNNKNEWMLDLQNYEHWLGEENDPYSERSWLILGNLNWIGRNRKLSNEVRKRALGILWEHSFACAGAARRMCYSLGTRHKSIKRKSLRR